MTRSSNGSSVVAGLAALAVAGCGMPGFLLPSGSLLRDVYTRGSPARPVVTLTFDDGPNGRCTEEVLDALRAVRAPATFFLIGKNVEDGRNDALIARMVREGHTIGVHSHRHWVSPAFLPALPARELRRATAAIGAALRRAGIDAPPPVTFFRPPYGLLTGYEARAAAEAGMAIIEWTVSVGDWKEGREPADVTAAILAAVRPGDVIVLHDGYRTRQRSIERCTDRRVAAPVVGLLVPALRARGLEPVSLASLLGLAESCAGREPGALPAL